MKVCTDCKQNKPLSDYYTNKTHIKSGIVYYQKSNCKVCHKKRTLNHSKKPGTKRKRKLNESKPEVKKRLKERMTRHNREYVDSGKLKEWQRMKRKTDLSYRLKQNLRCRLHYALKGKCKSEATMKLVGCSAEQATRWVQSQFKDGMTWDTIEVDHMMPCKHFDLSVPEQQKQCFHYTNLQPLFKRDNRQKSGRITHDMKWTGTKWLIRGANGLYQPRGLVLKISSI